MIQTSPRSSAALAALRGITPEDEIYGPEALLTLNKSLGGLTFSISGTAGYEFHQINSILNAEHIDFTGRVGEQFGACNIDAQENYLRQRTELDELATSVTSNIVTDDAIFFEAKCDSGKRISEFASVSPSWSTNSAKPLESSNDQSTAAKLEATYNQSELDEISVFGKYDSTIFPQRVVSIGARNVTDGYELYGAVFQYDHRFGPHFQISASVGNVWLTPKLPADPSFNGPIYSAGITYNPTERLKAVISTERRVGTSERPDAIYSTELSYSALIEYRLSNRCRIKLADSLTEGHFFGEPAGIVGDLTHQSIRSVSGSIDYDIGSKLSISFTGTIEHGGADIAAYGYNDSRAGLLVTAGI